MLPVYHRDYDARPLLLAVPACALFWCEGRGKWIALILSAIAITATAKLPFAFLALALAKTAPYFLAQLAPLSLLALGLFYLWVYRTTSSSRFGLNGASIDNAVGEHSQRISGRKLKGRSDFAPHRSTPGSLYHGIC